MDNESLLPEAVENYPVGALLHRNVASISSLTCHVIQHFYSKQYREHRVKLAWSNGNNNDWTARSVMSELKTDTLEF